jgi:hypothetical protein
MKTLWKLEGGLLEYREKIYIPQDDTLWREIIQMHHSSLQYGHPGVWKMVELIQWNYWWPGLRQQVKGFVAACDPCQWYKTFPRAPVGPLNPLSIPDCPWQEISVDMITDLPLSKGHDSILVIVNCFSKQAHFIGCSKQILSLGIARLYWDNVFRLHGLPDAITSDRGPQFASDYMRELCGMLSIKQRLSTAFHSQTDGQTEHVNQVLEQYLRLYISWEQYDWADHLAQAEFSYNNSPNKSTQDAPFLIGQMDFIQGLESRLDWHIYPWQETFQIDYWKSGKRLKLL